MSSQLKTLLVLCVIVVVFYVGYDFGTRHISPIEVVKTDTLIVYRNKFIDRPVPVYHTEIDTMRVIVENTIEVHDTAYVIIPREQLIYEDSLYTAWVSGYKPSLDSILLHIRQEYYPIVIQQDHKDKRWNLSLSAGYGASKDGLSPFFGVTLGWSIFSF